jgi:hypothetical protein
VFTGNAFRGSGIGGFEDLAFGFDFVAVAMLISKLTEFGEIST